MTTWFTTSRALIVLMILSILGPEWSDEPRAQGAAAKDLDLSVGFRQAQWGANIAISYDNGTMRYVSNGIPNHSREAEYAVGGGGAPRGGAGRGPGGGPGGGLPNASNAVAIPDPTRSQHYDFRIPTIPVRAATPTPTNLGTIGVMISGASLFNPYEGDGRTVAMQSNFSVKGSHGQDVWFLDPCAGHPTPQMGMYHYHALPKCVTATVDGVRGPSHIIGIAFDGYPIYGNRDINGVEVSAASLDACNGITSPTPEFPTGVYHYVLLDIAGAASSIRCFTGVVDPALVRAMPGMPGMLDRRARPGGPGRPPAGS